METDSQDPNLRISKDKKIKATIIFGLLIIGLVVTLSYRFEDFQGFVTENVQFTLAISLVLYTALGITFIPTSPITLFLAVLLGPLQAALVAVLGNSLSAFLEYKVGEALGDIFDFEENKARLPFNLGKLPVDSPYVLLFGRLIPGGGRGLSFIAGAYHVPMPLYLVTTITMNTLSAFFIAYGGEKLISLFIKLPFM